VRPLAGPILLLLLGPVASGELTVRLDPIPDGLPTPEGFLPATLHVADPNGRLPGVVGGIGLRRKAGGPTLLYAASVAPRTEQTLGVVLPAVSVQDRYVVRLLAEDRSDAPLMARREVAVTFPRVEAVEEARGRLLDPAAYQDWIEDVPRWPPWLPRSVFLAGAVFCAVLGGALFVRHPARRVLAVLVLTAGGTAAVARLVTAPPAIVTRHDGPLTVVTARRTTVWSCPADGVGPIYWSRPRFDADDAVIRPGGRLTVTVRPSEVRLFRRRPPATATAPRPGG